MKKFTDEDITKFFKYCNESDCDDCQRIEIERLEKESISKEKAYNNEYFLRKKIQDELKDYKAENERLLQKLQQAKSEALMHAFTKFAGHSDYHGDTILCQLACMAEGKETKSAIPIDMNQIRTEAIKEFAERLKRYSFVDNLSLDGKETVYVDDIDRFVKEMTEEK